MPTLKEIEFVIKRNLKTISEDEEIEVAFFGGTFTSLPDRLQERYLNAVYTYLKKDAIQGIRMSTHPEAVSLKAMKLFKKKGGGLVELGIQSLDKDVLRKIKREVDFKAVKDAVALIKEAGLKLGVQVMLGLPGDTLERSICTAEKLIRFKPETARIYPTLVIKGTEIARQYKKGRYRPLSMEKAIEQAARISDIFEAAGVKVIRIGLHPSKDLDSKTVMLSGPFHPAFGEMVRARQMRNRIIKLVKNRFIANRSCIEIHMPGEMFSLVSGHKGEEKKFLEGYFGVPVFLREEYCPRHNSKIRDVQKDIAIIDPRMPKKAKEKLKRLNFHIVEVPLHKKLAKPVRGHVDMMLFKYADRVIYEPCLEDIAGLLRLNGYNCIKGEAIISPDYPKDIIYNACAIDSCIIHYKGKVVKDIKGLKARHILIRQGYARCSIIPIDKRHIVTFDKNIKAAWEKNGGEALLVREGYVRLPGYKAGFIGGASGVDGRRVFFVGRLNTHPDGPDIRDFINGLGKDIIELYDGPLYDVGTVCFFRAGPRQGLIKVSP